MSREYEDESKKVHISDLEWATANKAPSCLWGKKLVLKAEEPTSSRHEDMEGKVNPLQ